jgi:hypothetical protein
MWATKKDRSFIAGESKKQVLIIEVHYDHQIQKYSLMASAA